jgi:hypothetical protein
MVFGWISQAPLASLCMHNYVRHIKTFMCVCVCVCVCVEGGGVWRKDKLTANLYIEATFDLQWKYNSRKSIHKQVHSISNLVYFYKMQYNALYMHFELDFFNWNAFYLQFDFFLCRIPLRSQALGKAAKPK